MSEYDRTPRVDRYASMKTRAPLRSARFCLVTLLDIRFLLSREYARGIALVVGSALSDCFDNHVDEPEAPRDDDHEQIEDEPAEGVLLGVTLAGHRDSFQNCGCVGGIGEVSRAARYPLGADRAFPCTSPR